MATSLSDTLVTVHPFAHRLEGDETIIANTDQSSFLAIPTPALDLLADLAAGRTVGQAQAAFALKYGETPDMEDFLELLAGEGFITPAAPPRTDPLPQDKASSSQPAGPTPRYHFEGISQRAAGRICSWPVLLICGLLIAVALVGIARDPSLLPPPTVMVFKENLTGLTLAMASFILTTIFLHELAHLVAARAAGVPARLGVSNRLWYLVAETDMTGIWLASRRERYLAILAGPLLDASSGAVLILVLWTNRLWPWLPPLAALLGQVFLFTYGVRLIWQCYFFVRTDFYYVISTFFHCKNLLGDTETWLRNQAARLFPGLPVVDQSAISAAERRVIRAYAVVWLVGRGAAFATLIGFSLPIFAGYGFVLFDLFSGRGQSTYSLVDALIWIGLTVGVEGTGLFLWIRGIYRSRSLARRMI